MRIGVKLLALLFIVSFRTVVISAYSSVPSIKHSTTQHTFSTGGDDGGCKRSITLSKFNSKYLKDVCNICMNAFFVEGKTLHEDMISRGSSIHQEHDDCCDILVNKIDEQWSSQFIAKEGSDGSGVSQHGSKVLGFADISLSNQYSDLIASTSSSLTRKLDGPIASQIRLSRANGRTERSSPTATRVRRATNNGKKVAVRSDFYPIVSTVAVSDDARRAGVGTLLLAACAKQARIWGYSQMFLEVRDDNIVARSFYEKLGFYEIPGSREVLNASGEKKNCGDKAAAAVYAANISMSRSSP